jgi:hypothetical protein
MLLLFSNKFMTLLDYYKNISLLLNDTLSSALITQCKEIHGRLLQMVRRGIMEKAVMTYQPVQT